MDQMSGEFTHPSIAEIQSNNQTSYKELFKKIIKDGQSILTKGRERYSIPNIDSKSLIPFAAALPVAFGFNTFVYSHFLSIPENIPPTQPAVITSEATPTPRPTLVPTTTPTETPKSTETPVPTKVPTSASPPPHEQNVQKKEPLTKERSLLVKNSPLEKIAFGQYSKEIDEKFLNKVNTAAIALQDADPDNVAIRQVLEKRNLIDTVLTDSRLGIKPEERKFYGDVLSAVMYIESTGNPTAGKGTDNIGLFQIDRNQIPQQYLDVLFNGKMPKDLFNEYDNTLLAAYKMKHMIKLFSNYSLAVTAFNIGDQAVAEAMKACLIKRGIDPEQVYASFAGMDSPPATAYYSKPTFTYFVNNKEVEVIGVSLNELIENTDVTVPAINAFYNKANEKRPDGKKLPEFREKFLLDDLYYSGALIRIETSPTQSIHK